MSGVVRRMRRARSSAACCCAPGARIVVCGATGGHLATVDLRRLFAMRLDLLGSTMGTRDELVELLELLVARDVRPVVDSTYGFSAVADAFARLDSGAVFGKVAIDRKSTRLNSSHANISYAVFCLKK